MIQHIAMVLAAEGLTGPEKLQLIAYCNHTDGEGDYGRHSPDRRRELDVSGHGQARERATQRKEADQVQAARQPSHRRPDPQLDPGSTWRA